LNVFLAISCVSWILFIISLRISVFIFWIQ
jgi:hypothetical protein